MGTILLLALGVLIGKKEQKIRAFIGNIIDDISKSK